MSRRWSCSAGQQRLRRCLAHAQGLGHGWQHEGGIDDGGKLYEVDAVDKMVEQIGGDLQGKPRLADAAGSGEGEQGHIFLEEKLLDLHEAVAAAEERAARQRRGCAPWWGYYSTGMHEFLEGWRAFEARYLLFYVTATCIDR